MHDKREIYRKDEKVGSKIASKVIWNERGALYL